MKIEKIKAAGYLGAIDVSLTLKRPINLIAGDNFAGKSSLREAIVHAFTGVSSRGTGKKKDYSDIVSDGQESGYVILDTDHGKAAVTLPNGTHEMTFPEPEGLRYVLNAQRFAHLKPDERRAFLFGLMKIDTTSEAIARRLIDRGCELGQVKTIEPYLMAGIEAGAREAAVRCREAKASWKEVTGEAYGSQKAITWRAPHVSWDDKLLAHAIAARTETQAAIDRANLQLGEARAQLRQRTDNEARLAGYKQQTGAVQRLTIKADRERKEMADWEQKVRDVEALAQGKKPASPLTCAHCQGSLVLKNGVLEAYEPPAGMSNDDAIVKYETYKQALQLVRGNLTTTETSLREAENAAVQARALEKQLSEEPAPITQQAIADIEADIEAKRKHLDALSVDITDLEQKRDQAASAEKKNERATALHEAVCDWEKIVAALSPDGIPAELLKGTLGPLNARLLESAGFAEWLPISIDEDMEIRNFDRLYFLLSESEQFRADCLIAEAISYFSGIKMLLLDRIDVLNQKGRLDLVTWLNEWATGGDIETVLLFGTFRERPVLDELTHTDVFWISGGRLSSAPTVSAVQAA